jgi:hypothetical protein
MSAEDSKQVRAERRAAPKPACVPVVHEGDHFVAHGDRPTFASGEGTS